MILGIETSCDETSVALLREDGTVVADHIASQIERHRPFGGVVPEIASREHLAHLFPLLRKTVSDGGATWDDVEAIAVTSGPGLIGALLVGVAGAQGLAYGLGRRVVPVNHLEGHIFSPYLQKGGPAIPRPDRFLALVISGGHSAIYDVQGESIAMLNRTRDDAIGETFDKVAKFVGLPYPGGPQVERLARQGQADPSQFPFPLPQFKDESLDFSYSGLKAAAIRLARELDLHVRHGEETVAGFCATFQDALFAQLFDRLESMWRRMQSAAEPPTELAMAGGVAANGVLRERMLAWGEARRVTIRLPEKRYCTDNGAMIAFAAMQPHARALDPRRIEARSRIR